MNWADYSGYKGISSLILRYRSPSETDTWATPVKPAMNIIPENVFTKGLVNKSEAETWRVY